MRRRFPLAQPVVADAELEIGDIAEGVLVDEPAALPAARTKRRLREPVNRGAVFRPPQEYVPQRTADVGARHVVEEALAKRTRFPGVVAGRAAAMRQQQAASIQFSRKPSPGAQKGQQHPLRIVVAAVVIQLAAVVEQLARGERLAVGDLLFVNTQIAVAVNGFDRFVGDGDLGVGDRSAVHDDLVHAPRPSGAEACGG